MWPFPKKPPRWTPPNSALTQQDFRSPGDFHAWLGFLDMREHMEKFGERLARAEGTLGVLVALGIATFLLTLARS